VVRDMTETEELAMVKERISITLPKYCVEWLDKQVETRTYATRSHAIELLIIKEMKA